MTYWYCGYNVKAFVIYLIVSNINVTFIVIFLILSFWNIVAGGSDDEGIMKSDTFVQQFLNHFEDAYMEAHCCQHIKNTWSVVKFVETD